MGICTSCERGTLDHILKSKPYMIIKESVTENEMKYEQVFSLSSEDKWGRSQNSTSYYLAKELGMVGLNLQTFNLSCLYMHIPPKSKKTKDDKDLVQGCLDYSVGNLIKVAKDMKIVMLMGAEVVRLFTGYGVGEVAGLVCKSDLLPDVPVIIPGHNPDKIMNMPIGELRNSLQVLAQQIKIYEQFRSM